MFISAVKLGILTWRCMEIDSLLEPASSGHSKNCSFIGFLFQTLRLVLGTNRSPSSGLLLMSTRLSFFSLLSVTGEGVRLSGGVGWAWGECERETSRLAGLKYLRKPSKACFTLSVPSGSVPSETNYNCRWATDERLDQTKQCTDIECAHTRICAYSRHTLDQLSQCTCTFIPFFFSFYYHLSPQLCLCVCVSWSLFLCFLTNTIILLSFTAPPNPKRLRCNTHRGPHTPNVPLPPKQYLPKKCLPWMQN